MKILILLCLLCMCELYFACSHKLLAVEQKNRKIYIKKMVHLCFLEPLPTPSIYSVIHYSLLAVENSVHDPPPLCHCHFTEFCVTLIGNVQGNLRRSAKACGVEAPACPGGCNGTSSPRKAFCPGARVRFRPRIAGTGAIRIRPDCETYM